jgi:membrane fusion protein (multidrug efflux system)
VKTAIIIVVVIGLAAGGTWYFNQEKKSSGRPPFGGPVKVVVEPVALQPLVKVLEALGTAHANESVTLTAGLNETVRRVNFEDGDFVEAGTILVELSNEEEEAQLAEARANLDEARRQLSRLQDLDKRGIAAQSDVDEARGRRRSGRSTPE